MAVTTFAACLNVLQRGGFRHDMLTANPARHDTMQLTGDGLVHLDAKVLQTAHEVILLHKREGSCIAEFHAFGKVEDKS